MSGRRDLPDDRIIRAVLDGDVESFAVLVERYQQRIYTLGMQFFRNAEDSLDFVQEVFIRAYERLESFRGESRFYSWLMRVAYNMGINSLKRTRRFVSLAEEPVAPACSMPEHRYMVEEAKRVLREAMKELPEKYAICIDLYFFYDLSHDEISSTTGFPVNTIKSHVFRGKRLLREALRGTAAEGYYET